MIPIFLLKFYNENKRDPILSELTEKQKLEILTCNMYCEDKLQELKIARDIINQVFDGYSKQIKNFKPLVNEILTDYCAL